MLEVDLKGRRVSTTDRVSTVEWEQTGAYRLTGFYLSICRPHLLIISLLLPLLGLCGTLYKSRLDEQYTGPTEVVFKFNPERIGTGGLPVCMWCYEIVTHVWHVDAVIEDSSSPSKLFVSLYLSLRSETLVWDQSQKPNKWRKPVPADLVWMNFVDFAEFGETYFTFCILIKSQTKLLIWD